MHVGSTPQRRLFVFAARVSRHWEENVNVKAIKPVRVTCARRISCRLQLLAGGVEAYHEVNSPDQFLETGYCVHLYTCTLYVFLCILYAFLSITNIPWRIVKKNSRKWIKWHNARRQISMTLHDKEKYVFVHLPAKALPCPHLGRWQLEWIAPPLPPDMSWESKSSSVLEK